MGDMRFRDMNGGEKSCDAKEGVGNIFAGRGRKRTAHWVHVRKDHWLGIERKWVGHFFFSKQWSSNCEVLEVCAICWSQAEWAVVLLWRGGWRAGRRWLTAWCGDLLACTGGEYSPSWNTFRRGYIASLRTRNPWVSLNSHSTAGVRDTCRGQKISSHLFAILQL